MTINIEYGPYNGQKFTSPGRRTLSLEPGDKAITLFLRGSERVMRGRRPKDYYKVEIEPNEDSRGGSIRFEEGHSRLGIYGQTEIEIGPGGIILFEPKARTAGLKVIDY